MHLAKAGTNPACQVAMVTNFVYWCLIFVDPAYGTYFMSLVWHLGF